MDEAPHLLHLFFLDEVQWVKVLDFGSDLAGMAGDVKVCDLPYATASFNNALPDLGAGVPNAADHAQAGYDNPSGQLLAAFRVLVNVIDGVLHGADLFGVLIGNLDIECLFESHDQLDCVERVCSEVIHEGGIGGNFALVHSKLLNNDLL